MIKITTTSKEYTDLPDTYTRVELIEEGSERFVERDRVTTLEIPMGKAAELTPRKFRILIRTIVQAAKKHKVERIALPFEKILFPKLDTYGEEWVFSTIAENILLAEYEFTVYKSKKKKPLLKEVTLCGSVSAAAKRGLERGRVLGTYVNACRDIANTPGGDMTPSLLGKRAIEITKGTKARVKVYSTAEIKKLKMGALLAVGQAAQDKPRFIVMEYWGSKKPGASLTKKNAKGRNTDKDNPIVFVGKGITFDTGGLNIKPGMAMYEMHLDMSGGAAVITAVAAAAKLGLKKNIIGLIPAAENAVSDEALRPGDVITSMSGKTIDVLHTDAEGRLVLADGLHFARRYNPRLVIDVATLTGASLVALGQHAHAVMTKDRTLEDRLRELGEESGDYVAPLPLWDEYIPYTKGVHGDVANIPQGESRFGGTINGAAFLSHFTEGMRWAHIDMAPRMTTVQSDKLAKGATGEPTRLLVRIAEEL